MNRISLLLADAHKMARQGIANILATSDRIDIFAQVDNGLDALDILGGTACNVALIDYGLPGLDGISTTERICCTCPHTQVIVVTEPNQLDQATQALGAGAKGVLLNTDAVEELVLAIETVVEGRNYISDQIKDQILHGINPQPPRNQGIESLSKREFEMFCLLAKGTRVRDCAEQMHIGESTASTYRARIMEKLHLGSTGEVIRYAVENGISR